MVVSPIDIDPKEQRTRFVGILRDQGVIDPLRRGAPPRPTSPDPTASLGAVVDVRVRDGVAHIEGVRATPGSAAAALYALAFAHGLDPTFPAAVEAQVAALVEDDGIDADDLHDHTDLPFVTIDDASSRDLDQAAYVERDGDDFVVWYALADAAYYVTPGSPLFDEALARGASYYLPGFMIPMLPKALSEGIVSLNPDVDRRAMMVRSRIAGDGRIVETTITRARIRSRAKLSFERVQAYYDDPAKNAFEDAGIAASLDALRAVGQLRMRDALEREVIRYRRVELDIHLSEQRAHFVMGEALRLMVERYNEQMSLLCNGEGARILRSGATEGSEVHPIYRIHAPPEAARIAQIDALLTALTRVHGLDPKVWRWRQGGASTAAEYLDALPTDGPLGRIASAVHRQAVMVNGRSVFDEQPGGHFGVGADVYARFSAPMREVVGVFLHKETWERLGLATPNAAAEDELLRDAIVARANEAKELQKKLSRESNRLVLDQLFTEDLAAGTERIGTVMGITRSRVHVMFDEPPIDVKTYLRDQPGELTVSDDGAALRDANGGMFCRLGDAIRLRVDGRDDARDRWKLLLLGRVG